MLELVSPVKVKALGDSVNVSDTNFPDINQKAVEVSPHSQKQFKAAKRVHEIVQAKVERIAEAMDKYVNSIQKDLHITVHNSTGKVIVKVISEENGKVIKEIPSEELLDLAAKLEEMTGALFNENA